MNLPQRCFIDSRRQPFQLDDGIVLGVADRDPDNVSQILNGSDCTQEQVFNLTVSQATDLVGGTHKFGDEGWNACHVRKEADSGFECKSALQ